MKAEPQIIRKRHREVSRRAPQPVSAWTISAVIATGLFIGTLIYLLRH